ncbi:hypothetical protein D3C86_1690730 [compost metagenome]
MQVRRRIVEQPAQQFEDVGVIEMMYVIDHQHQVVGVPGNRLQQDDDPVFERQLASTLAEQQGRFPGQCGIDFGNAGQQAIGQPRRLVVLTGQRQPGDVEVDRDQFATPGQQGAGLATPGRPLNCHTALPSRLHQAAHQCRAGHQLARAARGNDLGVRDELKHPVGRQMEPGA